MLRRSAALSLGALAFILLVTAGWWTLALWPVPASSAEWLLRTRAICFGAGPHGLPDAGGWVLLIGEPVGMLGVLGVVWGRSLGEALAALGRSVAGRVVLGLCAVALLGGVLAATWRVVDASRTFHPAILTGAGFIGRPAPALRLVDQHGDTVDLADYRGQAVMLAFAYGHCQTVCPVVVHDLVDARQQLAPSSPSILVVTLDPWRDTPTRLPSLAEAWGLSGNDHVLGGTVAAVGSALDAWGVVHERDPRTGDITHPAAAYLIDGAGRIAFLALGGPDAVAAMWRRLTDGPEPQATLSTRQARRRPA